MDELYFDNKKYITTKRAASVANYAKDYVGQLARSGKLDARLIGRNWYISEDALLKHAFGREPDHSLDENDTESRVGGDSESVELPSAQVTDLLTNVEDVPDVIQGGQHDAIEALQADPIQNNGLKYDVGNTEARYNEISEQPIIHAEVKDVSSGSVRYWNDDRDLFPQIIGEQEYNHYADEVDSDVSQSHGDTHLNTSKAEKLPSDDVSKITLTLRNRLNIEQDRKKIGHSPLRGNSMQRSSSTRVQSVGEVDVESDVEAANPTIPVIVWITAILALLIFFAALYYSFSSIEIQYIRTKL
jgi:hypothetical protein